MKIVQATAEIIRPHPTPEAIDAIYELIETAGRTCYKSKNKKVVEIEHEIKAIEEDIEVFNVDKYWSLHKELEVAKRESAKQFVSNIVKNGHEAMLEHANMMVKFTVDRGVSHELVRHRIASFAQSSTRFCNYSQDKFGNEITFIKPYWFNDIEDERLHELMGLRLRDLDSDDVCTKREAQYASWHTAMKIAENCYMDMIRQGATPEEARSVLPNSTMTEVIITADMREWRNIFKLRAAGEHGKPHPQMLEVMIPLLEECQLWMPELFGDIKVAE